MNRAPLTPSVERVTERRRRRRRQLHRRGAKWTDPVGRAWEAAFRRRRAALREPEGDW